MKYKNKFSISEKFQKMEIFLNYFLQLPIFGKPTQILKNFILNFFYVRVDIAKLIIKIENKETLRTEETKNFSSQLYKNQII